MRFRSNNSPAETTSTRPIDRGDPCGVVSRADSWVAVERYGKAKLAWLQGFLKLPNGIPSHDTIGRFFAALCPEQFRACFGSWVAEKLESAFADCADGRPRRVGHARGMERELLRCLVRAGRAALGELLRLLGTGDGGET